MQAIGRSPAGRPTAPTFTTSITALAQAAPPTDFKANRAHHRPVRLIWTKRLESWTWRTARTAAAS